jgi:hypothetical protein
MCRFGNVTAEGKLVFTTIAVLIVGCFVVCAVVLAMGLFTNGGRAREVLAATTAMPERRMRR